MKYPQMTRPRIVNILERLSDSASSTAGTARDRARLAARGTDRPSFGVVALVGLLGAGGGALLGFLLDPDRGRARRARLGDRAAATIRRAVRDGERSAKSLRSSVEARVAAIRAERTPQAHAIDDGTLTDRVRSIVLRDSAIPKGDLNINVERGIVVLRGEVPDEATKARLVSEVERVDGVWSVRDLLHLPGEPAVTSAAT